MIKKLCSYFITEVNLHQGGDDILLSDFNIWSGGSFIFEHVDDTYTFTLMIVAYIQELCCCIKA